MSACVSDWFFYSILYHETSKLVDNSQTGIQWRISSGLSFVLESYNLATLLKQTISYQLFYINLKLAHQRIMFYQYVPPAAFVYWTPKFFYHQFLHRYFHVCTRQQVNDTYLYSSFETNQLLRNYHVPIYLSGILGLYRRQRMWRHQQNYIFPYD